MNTKDFVVLPWGKSGNSVKLRYKHAQELRMEKVQLELENEEMERKLKEFRFARSKEKEEIGSSGYHWKSGKVGKLGNRSHTMPQSKENPVKFSGQNLRFKFLKEQTQESVKQPFNSKMADSLRSEKPKTKGRVCGQCENKAALLVCLECGEDYCSGCFAKIHQKGALKLHRTTLLQAKSQILSSVLEAAHQFIKEATPDEPKVDNTAMQESRQEPCAPVHRGSSAVGKRTESTSPGEKLSLEGSYSEAASAQSFQEALRQWRAGSHEEERRNLPKAEALEECEVQTTLKIWREPLHIEFKEDSLSYMEKLWLKKHRRTPPERPLGVVPGTLTTLCTTSGEVQCSQMETDKDRDEELNIENPEPSLKIVELDKTCEEDFGDPGSIVPYKVELADADYHRCCTFHEYQKNSFPYDNDIHHHVFNNGKMAHLHLCLRNSFTHCKDDIKESPRSDLDNMEDPRAYSPDTDLKEESSASERNVKENSVDVESNQKSDCHCVSLEREDSLESLDSEKPSIDEKATQDLKESLGFGSLRKRPDFEDSRTAHSVLQLQEIALRSKPVIQKYQGLERFFIFGTNEKVNSPSCSLSCTCSTHRNTFAGDKEWIPSHSLSTQADHAVSLDVLQTVQKLSTGRRQNTAQKSQRPSTANLPLSNSVKRGSRCLSSSPFQSRRAAAQSQSTTASEVSEIEDLDNADQNEPFSDDTADQQTIASLEKELNVLRNLADPSEEHYNVASEGLPASNIPSLTPSRTSGGLLASSLERAPCGVEQLSSSGNYTEIPCTLSLSESSTDEEEEFLDKQQVIVLPWLKNTS